MYIFLYILILLQLADAITTTMALRRPGTKEANPILRPLFTKFGVLPTLICVKSVICILLILYYANMPMALSVILSVIYSAIVINNLRVYMESK